MVRFSSADCTSIYNDYTPALDFNDEHRPVCHRLGQNSALRGVKTTTISGVMR
eukprot:COSAG02_NODE_57297_length_281_cov_0.631868_1_plen_52_part_01